eukprot:SAG11_NODE_16194_length_554_cov_5.347253_1_plen_56_part_10
MFITNTFVLLNYVLKVVVIWGVLAHPPQIIQKIMLKKIKLTLPICKRDYVTHSRDR